MTPTNACRDEYRNLSPARHCHLRFKRTGIAETPGGKPVTVKTGTPPRLSLSQRSEEVLAAITASGPIHLTGLRAIIGCKPNVLDNELERLAKAGLIAATRIKGRFVWQVAA